MKTNCPACRAIVGKSLGRQNCLCSDCNNTVGVRDAYDAFWVRYVVRRTAFMFTWFYPMLIASYPLSLMIMHKWSWGCLFSTCTCGAVWIFNVFWLFPYLGIKVHGRWDKMEEDREKLFLKKVEGKQPSDLWPES